MRTHVPLWLAITGSAGCLLLGAIGFRGTPARAQAGQQPQKAEGQEPATLTEYPYLPNRYGEAYIPSFAEWQALRLTSLGSSSTRITEEFTRQQVTCFTTPKGLVLTLDLVPQPTWKLYSGNGKFSVPAAQVTPDLDKAVDSTMRFVRRFFSEVRDKDVTMQVFIRSEHVAEWSDGKLKLLAEHR
jgi:hypothetical protein